MQVLSVDHFAPDGELLGQATLQREQLSARWTGMCRELLDARGPIFAESLGGTLSRFAIEAAGGMSYFRVDGEVLFAAVLIPSRTAENGEALLSHFRSLFPAPPPNTNPSGYPCMLFLNTFAPAANDQDREALFQLACHFGAAYCEWQEA
jgi:hypothetical protein